MSSPGQIIGGIVGGAIGFFNPALGFAMGAQLGLLAGGLIDPPKGQSVVGPRLDDLSIQTATYGAPLGRGYGTVCVAGNIFWLEGDKLKETTSTETQGGKGGGGSEVTTYRYSATFAVGLMQVPDGATIELRRLWLDTDLIYEAGSDNTGSVIASNTSDGFTFYNGADDQLPNARMQADKGAANVSAYPGLCYIVFEDLSLEKYSNTLLRAQVKAELVIGTPSVETDAADLIYQGGNETVWDTASVIIGAGGAQYVRQSWDTWNAYPTTAVSREVAFSDYDRLLASCEPAGIEGGVKGYYPLIVTDTDTLVSIVIEVPAAPYSTASTVFTFAGATTTESLLIDGSVMSVLQSKYGCYRSGDLFIFNGSYVEPVHLLHNGEITLTSTATCQSRAGGLSDNYLFLVAYTLAGTTTTIYKFSRTTLALVETWTGTADPYNAAIYVADDETVYTASRGHCYKWIAGSVVADFGSVIPPDFSTNTDTHAGFFKVLNDAPPYVVSWSTQGDLDYRFQIGHQLVAPTAAKLRDIVTDECSLAGISSGDLDLAALINSDVRGFRVAQRGAVRNSLEPLQAAYPFDVAQSGYKIKFVSRGGASVASIPEEDLAATDGTPGVLLPVAREMDSQLPFRVSIRYTDPDREYDIGEQAVERYEKDSLNERVMELPLSLTSGEAIQMADVLLAKEWTERAEFGPFALPPTWRHLEPADVVTVTHRGQDYTLRLTRVEYLPDGRLVCNAKLTAAASYTSSATAQLPLVAGQSLVPLKGSTSAYLLDIPRIRSEQDVPGLTFGLLGRASGWPGGTLLRSDDSGATWQAISAMNASAKVFTAGAALSAHAGYSVDHASVLTVTPEKTGTALYGITDDQFYAHTNMAAYGADGRWEIVAFKTVTDNSGSYTLKDFLRGLYGSEWASGLHASGDYFIVLDTATVSFFGLPTAAIGSPRLYRAITQGAALNSAPDISDTYGAENLTPLAPVDLAADRNPSSRDWIVSWQRRTRSPVELFSGASVPLGEASEAYEVEVYDSAFAALKRTISGLTSATASYTLAQQTADFGVEKEALGFKVYQLSSMVGRGHVLSGSLTRSLAADPYWESVNLLMHMDDTGLTDVIGHTVTINASAARSATSSKFGGYSAYFPGGGSLDLGTLVDWDIFGGDFTLEFQINLTSATANQAIFSFWKDNANYVNLGLLSGNIYYYSQLPGDGGIRISAAAPSSGSMAYVVFKKSGTTFSIEIDGTSVGTTTNGTYPTGNLKLRIGAYAADGTLPFTGYIDEVRLTKGVARTTSTPPTAAFQYP